VFQAGMAYQTEPFLVRRHKLQLKWNYLEEIAKFRGDGIYAYLGHNIFASRIQLIGIKLVKSKFVHVLG
jgi:hypothetical protein